MSGTNTKDMGTGKGTPEAVAFDLLHIVARAEKKLSGLVWQCDREYILRTYAECLNTIKSKGYYPPED